MSAFSTTRYSTSNIGSPNRSTKKVAEIITALGYTVVCGFDSEYCCDHGLVHSYVVITIMRSSGEYIYGAGIAPPKWSDDFGYGVMFPTETWPLLRKDRRRIGISHSQALNMAQNLEIRTIGNSLPADIVSVLACYLPSDILPPWEFAPLVAKACPVAEVEECDHDDAQRGYSTSGAACCVGKKNKESDSSSDDD